MNVERASGDGVLWHCSATKLRPHWLFCRKSSVKILLSDQRFDKIRRAKSVYLLHNTVLRMIAILEKKNCPRIRRFLTAAGGSLALCLGMMLGMYRVRVLTAIVCMAVETLMTTAAFSWSGWKTFMYRAVIFRLLSLLAEGSWQILRDYFHMPFPYSMAAGIFLPFFYFMSILKL